MRFFTDSTWHNQHQTSHATQIPHQRQQLQPAQHNQRVWVSVPDARRTSCNHARLAFRFIGLKPKHSVTLRNSKADPRVRLPLLNISRHQSRCKVILGRRCFACCTWEQRHALHPESFRLHAALSSTSRQITRQTCLMQTPGSLFVCFAGGWLGGAACDRFGPFRQVRLLVPKYHVFRINVVVAFNVLHTMAMPIFTSRSNVRFVKGTGNSLEVTKLLKVRSCCSL